MPLDKLIFSCCGCHVTEARKNDKSKCTLSITAVSQILVILYSQKCVKYYPKYMTAVIDFNFHHILVYHYNALSCHSDSWLNMHIFAMIYLEKYPGTNIQNLNEHFSRVNVSAGDKTSPLVFIHK